MLVNAKDIIVFTIDIHVTVGSPWCQQYGGSSLVGVGLSLVRVCGYLVASAQVFISGIEHNLTFRGYSSMMALASSIIWYVHADVLDVLRLTIV